MLPFSQTQISLYSIERMEIPIIQNQLVIKENPRVVVRTYPEIIIPTLSDTDRCCPLSGKTPRTF